MMVMPSVPDAPPLMPPLLAAAKPSLLGGYHCDGRAAAASPDAPGCGCMPPATERHDDARDGKPLLDGGAVLSSCHSDAAVTAPPLRLPVPVRSVAL